MTKQEKAEWLQRYRLSLLREKQLMEEIAMMRGRMTALAQSLGNPLVQGGKREVRAARGLERLEQLEAKLTAEAEKELELRGQIEQAIAAMQDQRLQLLLRMHYFSGKSWEAIADVMQLDERWLRRLHTRALEQLQPDKPGENFAARP